MRFETKARLGYLLLAVILAAGMFFSVHQLSSLADDELARVTSEQREISIVESMRRNGELLVSSGRGYLVSADPTLLAELQTAKARFDENARLLRAQSLDPEALQLVSRVEQTAENFMDVQQQLIDDRQRAPDGTDLVRRFDAELRPVSRSLAGTLNDLVRHEEAELETFYNNAQKERHELELWLDALTAGLVLLGFGVAWFFGTLMTRAYRQEAAALETARAALAARDELLAIVAHDLRNPLGAITMRAAMLREQAGTDKGRQQAETIENIAMRMGHQIRTMLDITAIEAHRFSVLPTRCELDDLVRETIELFEPVARSKQVWLAQKIESPGIVVHAERERIAQVLANLMANALKFTPAGGHVTISVDRHGSDARIGILDTGTGIPTANLPHVFDRFWHDEASGKKGAGLGLFIARGIVEAHGGHIWVESEPGHGARFYFTLPLETALPTAVASRG
jgi:signal transduction histidine kinase